MGLAERRAAQEFEKNIFPKLCASIADAAGFNLEVDVDWASLTVDDNAHLYNDAWAKVYFSPLISALGAITADDLGKEALKGSLKKIVIQNKSQNYYGSSMATLKDGILILDHEPCSNVDDVDDRAKGIQKCLEQAL